MRRQMYDLHLQPETPGWLAPGRTPRRSARAHRRARCRRRAARRGQHRRGASTSCGRSKVEAVAISLLFSFLDPTHEQRVRARVQEVLPGVDVSISSEVDPAFREYERTVVTAFDAYIKPVVDRYLANLAKGLAATGVPAPLQVMQSRGGLAGVDTARQRPVRLFLSGPAAGAIGSAAVGKAEGFEDLITIDVGGTSSDIALVEGGTVHARPETQIAGYAVRVPMLDVTTLGAGGGSIAWIDAGGGLRVGPHSAGADPGPACYGRGGRLPTVTDASIVLGYLDPSGLAGGAVGLDPALAHAAIEETIARPLGIDVVTAALGIHRIANGRMADGIRLVSVNRGLRSARVRLWCPSAVPADCMPPPSPTSCRSRASWCRDIPACSRPPVCWRRQSRTRWRAPSMAPLRRQELSDVRRELRRARSPRRRPDAAGGRRGPPRGSAQLSPMSATSGRAISSRCRSTAAATTRCRASTPTSRRSTRSSTATRPARRRRSSICGSCIRRCSRKARSIVRRRGHRSRHASACATCGSREAPGHRDARSISDRALKDGDRIVGPAIIEQSDSTTLVPPAGRRVFWRAEPCSWSARDGMDTTKAHGSQETFDPVTLEVLRHRLDWIAEEMQATLLKSSCSPIVKEGLDASASIFTLDGTTLAQACAIPIHLGTLIPAVAEIIRVFPGRVDEAGRHLHPQRPLLRRHAPARFRRGHAGVRRAPARWRSPRP